MMVGLMMGWGVSEQGWRKGPWTPEEDKLLTQYVSLHGEGRWSCVAKSAGLNRRGKSCRLRWVNYLRPGLKRGQISPQEEGIITELHALWGNKWSTIARYLPGRTDNEIKNFWRTHFKNKEKTSQRKEKPRTTQLRQKQLQELQQNDMSGVVSHTEEPSAGDKRMTEAQGGQESRAFTFPTFEDQSCLPVTLQDVTAWWDPPGADGSWEGLWNLDDDRAKSSYCKFLRGGSEYLVQ